MKYYIARDDKPLGPFELDELKLYSIKPETLIWIPGNPDWKEARMFPEVMAIANGEATPPPFIPSKFYRQPDNVDPTVYEARFQSDEYGSDGRYQPLRPNNYLAEAIVVTILCCNPLGIISIVYASKVNKLYDQRRFDEARRASANARNWFLATLLSGIISWIMIFVR